MRSRAIFACSASCAGTEMRLTTLPSARFSSVHARCWGSMRCMVEHAHRGRHELDGLAFGLDLLGEAIHQVQLGADQPAGVGERRP